MNSICRRTQAGTLATSATTSMRRAGILLHNSLVWGVYLLVALILVDSAQAGDAVNAPQATRTTQNAYFIRGGRDREIPDRIETPERQDTGEPAKSNSRTAAVAKNATLGTRQQAPNTEFWFYTADTELFADNDLDGYFYGIDLLFDADTIYEYAAVYAVVYLSRNGGPWLEYAVTEVFEIYGATGEDEFVIVTELLAGYPTGSYDILVELFDTYDNAFVASIGPENTPELSFLPLEDAEVDAPYVPPVIVVEQGGGGSMGPLLNGLLLLLLLSWRARRNRV